MSCADPSARTMSPSRRSLVLTDTARVRRRDALIRAAGRGGEPRLLRPAPSDWTEAHRRAAVHPSCRQRLAVRTVRHASVARRGHARVQRGRRARAVPRRHPRLPGDVAQRAWPALAAAPR